jgi:glutathione synthase/RimK-type ligase-like ATP-grasp enzyme
LVARSVGGEKRPLGRSSRRADRSRSRLFCLVPPAALSRYGLNPEDLEFARDEWRAALEAAYALCCGALWVSHPDRLREAARKPAQLLMAQDLGLQVPRTCITNDEQVAAEFIHRCNGRVIVKATGAGWISTQDGSEVAYVLTNRLGEEDYAALGDVALAPVTFQEEIPKAYEVRVHVVGQEVLAIRIDSQKSSISALDWRRYDIERTPYSPYSLPQEVARQCATLTRRCGLQFGAIDLIRTPEGEYVFLEINGNGQFLWAEELSGVARQ